MRHNWIIDVLTDLRSYAEVNNLPGIARAAQQTLDAAVAEISAVEDDAASDGIVTD